MYGWCKPNLSAGCLLAAITIVAAANNAPAGSVDEWQFDDGTRAATTQPIAQLHPAKLPDDAWLLRPSHSMGGRPAAVEPADSTFHAFAVSEQTLIPLPAAEWSGLVGLVGLALVRARKSLRKMFM